MSDLTTNTDLSESIVGPEVDYDARLEHLNKHMQRLPWAAQNLDTSPGGIRQFINDWLVPLITDLQHVATGAYVGLEDMSARLDEHADELELFTTNIGEQVDNTLLMVRSTVMGETLALLHMHYKSLHMHLIDKLPPADSASVALIEMHEIFVRAGMEPPVGTPREVEDQPSDAVGDNSQTAS